MDPIESRLAKIETQLRFQRRIIVFLIILLVAGISYGATAPIPEVIQAGKFEVVNAQGNVVVALESWKLGGKIYTFSAKGLFRPSIVLTHTDEGHGMLNIYNNKEDKIINAKGTENGNAELVLSAGEGKGKIFFQMKTITGSPGMFLDNKNGEQVVQIYADKTGNGAMAILNRKGKGRVLRPR